jgi:hypothetical protein
VERRLVADLGLTGLPNSDVGAAKRKVT